MVIAWLSLSVATSQQPPRDPYVDRPEYLSFPWMFTVQHAYIFVVSPIHTRSTPPPAYTAYPAIPWTGGNGMLSVLKYTNSPIGEYSEIMYSPGFHAPDCGTNLQSVTRIWVDSVYSQRAGRSIWGIPKVRATGSGCWWWSDTATVWLSCPPPAV